MPTPAFEKNNAMTEVIRRAQRINAEAGLPAGRNAVNQPVTVGSGTSVRSAAMNDPRPLSAEEVEARDARARELGLLPKLEGEDNPYGSLADAQAAGMPVELNTALDKEVRRQGGMARPSVDVPASQSMVRLPDFTKVQMFDFIRNVIYIDGLEFAIPADDVRDMKRYAVDLALDHVVKQLADALIAFGVPQELANQMGASVREKANGTGQGEGTTSDAGTERQSEGSDQEAAGPSRPE
jgi:hypothetical protein